LSDAIANRIGQWQNRLMSGGRMKSMNRPILAGLTALALGLAFCCTGCGKENATQAVDTKPFEAAIGDYLRSQGFGMKIASVQSIDQKGDTATAVCKMQEAEGTYGLTVTWQFSFRRRDRQWQVESYIKK
jgi:hypothetical protein